MDFQESLGALFRAGVELDFKSQYPRPKPITHLLPGHPKKEEAKINFLVDDEMFINRGPYSHGPMTGRKVNSDHTSFEARLSEADYAWLTEHRVQHVPIVPAAGYLELVLQAFEGAPIFIEALEFLSPCPIREKPVKLHTTLHPVESSPDEYTVTMISRSFENESETTLHCRGRVRRLAAGKMPDTPSTLKEILESGYSPDTIISGDHLYSRNEDIMGKAFEYGPRFRNIEEIRHDSKTKQCLFDISLDEDQWRTAGEEGYVLHPRIGDSVLQVYLRFLVKVPHIQATPYRMENVTFLGRPPSPRITCYTDRDFNADFSIVDRWGQFDLRHGEQELGSISLYDRDTGMLFAHIGNYISLHRKTRKPDIVASKLTVHWQPKFVPPALELLGDLPENKSVQTALIAALEQGSLGHPYACRVAELSGSRAPEETFLPSLQPYLSSADAQTEYWMIADTSDSAHAHFDAFRHYESPIRFDSLDRYEAEKDGLVMDAGLLRPSAVELVLLHNEAASFGAKPWPLCQQLLVAGGLALVLHEADETVDAGVGWEKLQTGAGWTLLQSPNEYSGVNAQVAHRSPRWVIGDGDSWAAEWADLFDPSTVHLFEDTDAASTDFSNLEEVPHAPGIEAIEFFCGADPADPTGELVSNRLIAFLQALLPYRTQHATRDCTLSVVTRGVTCTVDELRGSALWGAIRSIEIELQGENARLDLRLVDIQQVGDLEVLRSLDCSGFRERELAIRDGRLWVPRITRLRRYVPELPKDSDAPYALGFDKPGQIDGLYMSTVNLRELGPTDVEIEIAAAALNFRDIMVALGLLPELAYEYSALGETVGVEASGVVRRVGLDVTRFEVGDEVVFVEGGCIGNRIVKDEVSVFHKPKNFDIVQASATQSAHQTTYTALIHLARLRKGQRVLIHSAMGGVGQVAIALAKHVGAEFYTTAGNPEKRAQLMAMGAKGAFDSHSYDWYDDLMDATDGEGVDVVLNSLSGHHITLCLKAIRAGGWHCELGKVDIFADSTMSMRVFRKNLRFVAIDSDRMILDDPLLTYELTQECLDLQSEGVIPPLPLTIFPYAEYKKALRLMAAGKHQGKIVLKAPSDAGDPGFPIADFRPFLDAEGTYLVTGGFGELGVCLMGFLTQFGARHITLMDRDPARRRSEDWLRQKSSIWKLGKHSELEIVSGDVENEEDVRRAVAGLKRPLKGVFHLAGALEGRLLMNITPSAQRTVFGPKATGAWHLHNATAHLPLDHFVLFSSVASTFGNAGQIGYSAANAFVDALASWRRSRGLPALAFNLTGLSDTGMASRSLHVVRMIKAAGIRPANRNLAFANLHYAMVAMGDTDHLVTGLFSRPPWNVNSPDYLRNGQLMVNKDGFKTEGGSALTIESVIAQISAKVADLCGDHGDQFEEPLASFGLTSVTVAELIAFLQMQFDHQVGALELMTASSISSLALAIVQKEERDDASESVQDTEEARQDLHEYGQATRRPSAFANALEDYFTNGTKTDRAYSGNGMPSDYAVPV